MEKRYWNRVGMYVTEEFANEWIGKMNVSDGQGGRHLDEDIEEYIVSRPPTPDELRAEIKELFEQPFEEVELPLASQAIILLHSSLNSGIEIGVLDLQNSFHSFR